MTNTRLRHRSQAGIAPSQRGAAPRLPPGLSCRQGGPLLPSLRFPRGKAGKKKKTNWQTLARSTRIPTSRTRSAAAGRLRARPSLLRQGKKASGCPNPDGREVYIFPPAVCCTQRASVYRQIKEIHVCFYPKHAGSPCSAPLGCKQRHRFAGRGRGTQTQVAAELLQLRGTKQLSFNCTKLPAHHFLFFFFFLALKTLLQPLQAIPPEPPELGT